MIEKKTRADAKPVMIDERTKEHETPGGGGGRVAEGRKRNAGRRVAQDAAGRPWHEDPVAHYVKTPAPPSRPFPVETGRVWCGPPDLLLRSQAADE